MRAKEVQRLLIHTAHCIQQVKDGQLLDWVQLIHLGLWRDRLQPDYLARRGEYRSEFIKTIHEMGGTGQFWQAG